MVLYCGIIVCTGGVNFVSEIAEVFSSAVTDDGCTPQALVGGKPHTLISRAGISLLRVPGVLGDGCQAQVGLVVVEAAAVYVVDDVSFGGFDELTVHEDARVSSAGQEFGIEHIFAFCPAEMPFVSAQPLIVLRIDYGKVALGQRDSAERVAEAQTPTEQHQLKERPNKP